MPNWCGNNLIVTGKQEDIDKLKVSVRSEHPLDFERVLPLPADPKEQLKQSEGTWPEEMDKRIRESMGAPTPSEEARLASAWYNWRVAHWGTKWNLSEETQVTEEPGKISYFFDTAWSPPEPIVAAMAKQHPTLVFLHQWWELGNDFAGWREYREGRPVGGYEGTPDRFDFVPVPDPEPEVEYVLCSVCGKCCLEHTAHRHQDRWIGDECCWDERLRASE